MNFYEDIGVQPGATVEAVRERYRVLVRLFHPDQFADPVLKAAAEVQMRRLNEVVAVLTDSGRRREYDASLCNERSEPPIIIQAPPLPHPERKFPLKSVAWGTAAIACSLGIVWLSDHEGAPAPNNNQDWRTRVSIVTVERDRALRELARLKGTAGSHDEARSVSNLFAGLWFFAHQAGPKPKSFTPEFIELRITEAEGRLRGKYRSRYPAGGRAIPPSVNFEFSGPGTGNIAKLPLVRDDGARGEIQLRLISEHELEVGWNAASPNAPALSTGTAVLVKSQ